MDMNNNAMETNNTVYANDDFQDWIQEEIKDVRLKIEWYEKDIELSEGIEKLNMDIQKDEKELEKKLQEYQAHVGKKPF